MSVSLRPAWPRSPCRWEPGQETAPIATSVPSSSLNWLTTANIVRDQVSAVESALGPYDGPDNLQAIEVAPGLRVSLVSSSVASAADQIALWPDDDNPTFLFVCDEETTCPPSSASICRGPPAATRRRSSLACSCDPVRRTPWGTIIVAEEAGATGGFYELIDPAHINTVIAVIDRDAGDDE